MAAKKENYLHFLLKMYSPYDLIHIDVFTSYNFSILIRSHTLFDHMYFVVLSTSSP